ncbi:Uncharacterized protein Adt_33671 [Abeliophyllum distichum]|uniref:Uncharacterized protein n=1 Tax=Abeliophyllum distichum TaxID=126358 RepID=A0ABD1QWY2_9LAMI
MLSLTLSKTIRRRVHKKRARLLRDNRYCARIDQYIMETKRKCEVLNSELNIMLEDLSDEVRVRSAKMEEIDAEQEALDECEELDAQIEAHKRRVKELERRDRQLLGTHIGYLTETEEKDRS